jgi:RNA polymerase sigma-70 factor (ECF subfamily)
MDEPESAARLAAAGKGDMEAFAALFEELRPMVYEVACRLVGPSDADDVVMETYLKAWRAIPRFNRRAALKTWLYRVTYNCALDFLRSRQRRRDRIQPLDGADSREIGRAHV